MQFATPAEREAFILANRGLVYQVVNRTVLRKVSEEDAVSVGMLALIDSVDKFDPSRGFKFSTYAYNAIRIMVHAEVNCTTPIGRVPKHAVRYASWQRKGKAISREQEKCINAMRRCNAASGLNEDTDKAERACDYWDRVHRQAAEVVIATSELDEFSRPIMMERLGINQGCQVKSWTDVARATGRNRNSLKVQMRGTLEYLRDRVASVALTRKAEVMDALSVGDQALLLFPAIVFLVLMLGMFGNLLWIVAKGAWEGDTGCRAGLVFMAVLAAWACLMAWRGPTIQKTLDAAAKAEKKGGE